LTDSFRITVCAEHILLGLCETTLLLIPAVFV